MLKSVQSLLDEVTDLVQEKEDRKTMSWVRTLDSLIQQAGQVAEQRTPGLPVVLWAHGDAPREVTEMLCLHHLAGADDIGGEDLWAIYATGPISEEQHGIVAAYLKHLLEIDPVEVLFADGCAAWLWTSFAGCEVWYADIETELPYRSARTDALFDGEESLTMLDPEPWIQLFKITHGMDDGLGYV